MSGQGHSCPVLLLEYPMSIIFTPEQTTAIDKTLKWYTTGTKAKPVFEFTGLAGTGKTTCVKEIVSRLGNINILYAAYTGKAARVLSRTSGRPASTIHSLIYAFQVGDAARLKELVTQIYSGPDLPKEERADLIEEYKTLNRMHFGLNDKSELKDADLLILDECSMLPAPILKDLKSFGVPILALGDPGQLPPPEGDMALFQGTADVCLTEIHRQALDNPIIAAAAAARSGRPFGVHQEGAFRNAFYRPQPEELDAGDIILCGKHKTRRRINSEVRKHRGFDWTNPMPQVGETLICRKNDRKKGLFNGDIVKVLHVGDEYEDYIELTLEPEDGRAPLTTNALKATFQAYFNPDILYALPAFMRRKYDEFDFGYAITVHSSQGSQWDHVVFYDDGLYKGWKKQDRKKLVYTAVTRAVEQIQVYTINTY